MMNWDAAPNHKEPTPTPPTAEEVNAEAKSNNEYLITWTLTLIAAGFFVYWLKYGAILGHTDPFSLRDASVAMLQWMAVFEVCIAVALFQYEMAIPFTEGREADEIDRQVEHGAFIRATIRIPIVILLAMMASGSSELPDWLMFLADDGSVANTFIVMGVMLGCWFMLIVPQLRYMEYTAFSYKALLLGFIFMIAIFIIIQALKKDASDNDNK